MNQRLGVYICHCGGNISDTVDVDATLAAVANEPGVVVARTSMFTCSDATQEAIVHDIEQEHLDGMVVASCSPTLHTMTFRGVARRAGLNPYRYTQVNIREQCAWAHTGDRAGATRKAIRLVRAGIARARLTEALEPTVVQTVPRALVVGGGIAGLRAALGLASIGLGVVLVEREPELGGYVGQLGSLYPTGRSGGELIRELVEQVRRQPAITVHTAARLVAKAGTFGDFRVTIAVDQPPAGPGGPAGSDPAAAPPPSVRAQVGTIIVATGFTPATPELGAYGFGIEGVVTLPEFTRMVDAGPGPLTAGGRSVRAIAYIYCVGRRDPSAEGAGQGCAQYCCTATVHTALRVAGRDPDVRQYHLYRDLRTYGRYELLYDASRRQGSVYLRFAAEDPPRVSRDGASGRLAVAVSDRLEAGAAVEIPVDLVVLVTGMAPRPDPQLAEVLKVPVGRDGFFHEVHPKLRPVATVVDGVLVCGACQGPKGAGESVASALAAVGQTAALLKRGSAELDPQVAVVAAPRCTGCERCLAACPFGAIGLSPTAGGSVAVIDAAGCKGCGACVPTCPEGAIDLLGHTDQEVTAMIDALAGGTPA